MPGLGRMGELLRHAGRPHGAGDGEREDEAAACGARTTKARHDREDGRGDGNRSRRHTERFRPCEGDGGRGGHVGRPERRLAPAQHRPHREDHGRERPRDVDEHPVRTGLHDVRPGVQESGLGIEVGRPGVPPRRRAACGWRRPSSPGRSNATPSRAPRPARGSSGPGPPPASDSGGVTSGGRRTDGNERVRGGRAPSRPRCGRREAVRPPHRAVPREPSKRHLQTWFRRGRHDRCNGGGDRRCGPRAPGAHGRRAAPAGDAAELRGLPAIRRRRTTDCAAGPRDRRTRAPDACPSRGLDGVVPLKGLEPPTPSLRMTCSTS